MVSTATDNTDAMEVLGSQMEAMRVELHQRIAVHEQETVRVQSDMVANAEAEKIKYEKLIEDRDKMLKDAVKMKEEIKRLEEEVEKRNKEVANMQKVYMEDATKKRIKDQGEESPDWHMRLDRDLKPNFEMASDQKKFQEWRKKMVGHFGSGDRRLVDYVKWAEK